MPDVYLLRVDKLEKSDAYLKKKENQFPALDQLLDNKYQLELVNDLTADTKLLFLSKINKLK